MSSVHHLMTAITPNEELRRAHHEDSLHVGVKRKVVWQPNLLTSKATAIEASTLGTRSIEMSVSIAHA